MNTRESTMKENEEFINTVKSIRPTSIITVDELPETGKPGVMYTILKDVHVVVEGKETTGSKLEIYAWIGAQFDLVDESVFVNGERLRD